MINVPFVNGTQSPLYEMVSNYLFAYRVVDMVAFAVMLDIAVSHIRKIYTKFFQAVAICGCFFILVKDREEATK